MSDEPFRRPGSEPWAPPLRETPPAAGWEPGAGAAAVAGPATPTPDAGAAPADAAHPSSSPRRSAAIGVAGLLIGLVGGFILVRSFEPTPRDITPDTFPHEVLGRQRDDIVLRAAPASTRAARPDVDFRKQRDRYRFAYGDDGAEFTYGEKYSLTIVNGRIPTIVPSGEDGESEEPAWVVSLESADTHCVSQDPPTDEEPPFDLTDVLDDDSKDVFFYLERNLSLVQTECVFFDEKRNVSLRLKAEGRAEDIRDTAATFRGELARLHADLID